MPKKNFTVEITRRFETREQAIKAAQTASRKEQDVVVFEETKTDSGQCYERGVIWKNGSHRSYYG